MGEMEERMRSMEDMFARRLMRVMEHNEEKMDAKLDMIQRSRLLSGGSHVPRSEGGYSDSVADSVDSDAIGQLRMSEHEDAQSSVAGVRTSLHLTRLRMIVADDLWVAA